MVALRWQQLTTPAVWRRSCSVDNRRKRDLSSCALTLRPANWLKDWSYGVCPEFLKEEIPGSRASVYTRKTVVIGWEDGKNWLTFDGDLVLDTASGSLFHFRQRCRIEHFGDLLGFLIQSLAAFHETRQNDWCQLGNESSTFWQDTQIWISSEIRIRMLDYF